MTVPLKPLKELFLLALEVPADDRAEWLDRECAGDEALREQLNLMLAAHDAPHTLLDQPSKLQLRDTLAQPINEKPGTEIGPYKLLQQVGEGGMGVVYLAEQKDPVKRRVALKIIKPGMDTRQVIARFEAERQALAMMDHPNIAKVLDAGATKSGRPYFVMELVNGVSITQYCDEQHLTPKERLDLFVPICQAVQHAHQKGIIHRDLKPSNILVAEYDHRAVPKIIDFGVAKATSQTLTEKTMFTQLGQIVGTLEYMSPEQAKRNQLDVDTRSDIYSLGVVLYELLTGETPFDRERLRSAAFDEMLRIIREEEPSKPSTKVSSSQSLPSIAANRRIEPTKLGSMIRGELDWIVLKAMEKDRARRYETASKFAEDVQHYLNDEPVVACPPSRAYKFRKFARRNKVAIATSAAIMLCLIGGIVGTVSQARWAIQERNRAIDAEKEAQRNLQLATASESRANDQAARAVEEAENATTQAAIAKAINDFLNNDLLAQADPDYQPNRDITLRSLLDLAATRLDGRFPDQPLVEAAIHETIGRTYLSLGEVENAQLHNRMALKLQQRALGPEHPQTIKSMYLLANAINPHKPTPNVTDESSKTAKEAEKLIREALQIQRRVLGYEHPDTLEGMHQLARSIDFQGRHAEAEQLYCDLLEIVERVLDVKSRLALSVRRSLAYSIYKQGRHSEAEESLQKTLEIAQQAIGPEHRFTLNLMNDLMLFMGGQGKHSEREQLGRELLKIKQLTLGPDNPSTLMQVGNLAASIMAQGRYAEAEEMLAESWKARLRILGPEHRYTKLARYQMIDLYRELGSKSLAEGKLDQAIANFRRHLEFDPSAMQSWQGLLRAYRQSNDQEQFDKSLTELLTMLDSKGAEIPKQPHEIYKISYDLKDWSLPEPANAVMQVAVKRADHLRLSRPTDLRATTDYATTLRLLGSSFSDSEEGAVLLEQAARVIESALDKLEQFSVTDAQLSDAHRIRGEVLFDLAKMDQAFQSLHRALELQPENALNHWALARFIRDTEQPSVESLLRWTPHAVKSLQLLDSGLERAVCSSAVNQLAQVAGEVSSDRLITFYLLATGESLLGNNGAALGYWEHAERLRLRTDSPLDEATTKWRNDAQYELRAYLTPDGQLDLASVAPGDHLAARQKQKLLIGMAEAYSALGQHDKALADYTEAIRLDPNDYTPYASRAELHLRLGNEGQALADYTEAIRLNPRDSSLWAIRALRYAQLQQWEKAIEDTTRAIELDSSNIAAYADRAWARIEIGQLEEAVDDCNKALSLDPNSYWNFERRAWALNKLGKHREAIQDAENAIRIDSRNIHPFLHLIDAHRGLKQWEQAIEVLNTAIQLAPDDHALYGARAELQFKLENYEQAIADYTEAIQRASTVAWYWQNRAKTQLQLKDYEQAIAGLDEAIRLGVPEHWAYRFRAEAHMALGQHDRALADCDEAIRIKPDDPTLYILRAEAFLTLGRVDEALADGDKAVELNPDYPRAALNRVQLLVLASRTEEYGRACREMLDRFGESEREDHICHTVRACTLAPTPVPDVAMLLEMAESANSKNPRPFTLITLAMAHVRAGQFEQAAAHFQESLNMEPNQVDCYLVHLGLSLAHLKLGKPEEARQSLDKAVDLMEQEPGGITPRLIGKILRREVEELLRTPEADNQDIGSEQDK